MNNKDNIGDNTSERGVATKRGAKKKVDVLEFWESMTQDEELPPQVRLKASENLARYREEGEDREDVAVTVLYK